MMKNLLTSSSKSLQVPVDYSYHRHRNYTSYTAFITTLLLTVITINTITAPSCCVTASITLLDPSSSSSSSPSSHASYDSSNDPKYGRQLLNGYEYYSRLQYIPNNPSLCKDKPEVNYTITIPNDALPVSLLLTTTPTTDNDSNNSNENSTDCSLLEKIQNVLTHVEPIGRVRYLIVTTTEDSSLIASDYNTNYVHVEGTLEEVFQIQTNGDNMIHIMTLDELENHFNNNNNNDYYRIRSHSSTQTSLHNSWMNKLNQLSKNLMESLRKKKKKKSNKDSDTDDQSDNNNNKKDDSHVDIPFYIIHVSVSTQKDIYSYLQQYLLHNNNQFVNGGPQISIDTNRHGHHYYNHNHNNNDPNQTILYMALIIFVAAGSCFIILLFCTNSDWDEDALNHLNNNQTNTTTRPTRQRLTKAQVREIYPIYRYDGLSKLYRIKVKQQQQQQQSTTESTLTDPTVNSSNTSDTDTLRQPLLLSTQEQQDIYEEEIIDNIQIDTCSICLDEYEINDKLRIIPNCQHVYHSKCIGRWLSERSAVCPLCKVNLYIDPEVENDHADNENNNTNSDTNNTASTNNINNNEEVVAPSISNDISTSIWHRVIERLFVSPNITTSTELTTNINPIETTTIPDMEFPSSNHETNITTTATNSIANDIEMSISIDNNDNVRSSSTMTRSWWSRMFPSSTTTIRQPQQVDNDATTNTTSTMNMLTEPLLSSSSTTNVIDNDTSVQTDVETAHPSVDTPTTMNTISEDATDVASDVESTLRPLTVIDNNATTTMDSVPNNNNVHDSNNNSDNGDTGKIDDNNDNDTASIVIMDTTDPLAFPSSPIV